MNDFQYHCIIDVPPYLTKINERFCQIRERIARFTYYFNPTTIVEISMQFQEFKSKPT